MNDPTRFTDDEALLARLGAIAEEIDPPSDLAYELGYEAFRLYRIDDELADLVADSRLAAQAVRAAVADIRLLSFECPGLSIEIQISREGTTNSVLGQLMRDASAVGGRAHLETPAGPLSSVAIDPDDRFEFREAPDSLVRFRIEAPGGTSVTTAWVEP